MKRLLLGLTLMTCLSLVYVQQRVALVGLGYTVENLRHTENELLDQHRILHYNVLTLQSPVILSQRLAHRDVQLAPPREVEILPRHVRLNPGAPVQQPELKGKPLLFGGIWRLAAAWLENGRPAEAEPISEDR